VRQRRSADRERGSAVVEFTLVSVVLTALLLGVLQLGLVLHVRNTLVACAAEGARVAANADRGPADGVAATRALVTSALSADFARDVTAATVAGAGGTRLVEVSVAAPLPLVGLLGPDRRLHVVGHAVEEAP
jgi:Flp pilus assembly protein TadG